MTTPTSTARPGTVATVTTATTVPRTIAVGSFGATSSQAASHASIPNRASRTTVSARRKRESSPPLAILASGAKSAPGLVAMRNSTLSIPCGPQRSSGSRLTCVRKRAASSLSGASSAATPLSSRSAAVG